MDLNRMPEVHCGNNAVDALVNVLAARGSKRVFIVTGPHVSKTAGFRNIVDAITRDHREVSIFSDTRADPTLEQVDEMAARARAFEADAVIGIGGGSPLDASKVVAVQVSAPGSAADFVGLDLVPPRTTPLLAVPTSAGTGSEVTRYSILTDTVHQIKAAVSSAGIIPDHAFLIPEMTYSMPPSVTAATGLDAFCHATEAYLSKKRNSYSDVMALKAVALIAQNLEKVFNAPGDEAGRENMLLASLFAGLAFANASVTAVHAFAYPLGGRHHVPHGLANSLMYAPVFRHNLPGNEARCADLAEAFCGVRDAAAFIPAVVEMKKNLKLPMSLAAAGIPESDLEIMSQSVMGITRLLQVNPNEILPDDARRIYHEAYEGR